jgi:transposase-like protein
MSQQQTYSNALKERQIQLTLQALKQDAKLSVQRAAAIFSASKTTLRARRAGQPSRVNTIANSQNLTSAKEQVIVMRILKLVTRGESPQLKVIASMANSLQKERSLAPVGPRWASRFVSRQEELKTVFNRKYN